MQEFWFYTKLGFNHVMDFGAYDHILFLAALAVPFTFKSWKKVLILCTMFTVAHCLSLALSAYGVLRADEEIIEFLIPVTIFLTGIFNLFYTGRNADQMKIHWHALFTTFFGFIHGFGFSNYFNMMMAELEDKLNPLLGFALGIEISQALIILSILLLGWLVVAWLKLNRQIYIAICSVVVLLITIPMLLDTLPA
ncbi:HupE/UreJ family protein [Lentiprolixibacter aurantiacus]|uniref:HupE/UreJ family protein n=1 Tax=Lentiprolixibacter aurantiacus TaxID=2993939 RepID=A0AAE3MJ11_9FLAO|nr:HupE/UreJ family protein [Lentiprolixibacter aurantiacus]MCX2718690.1 HupE/UreJ family protein [Lentiprolixibacter aurantiacus]